MENNSAIFSLEDCY